MDFIELAGGFLAIAGDEWHGRTFGDELGGGADTADRDARFLGDEGDVFGGIVRSGESGFRHAGRGVFAFWARESRVKSMGHEFV